MKPNIWWNHQAPARKTGAVFWRKLIKADQKIFKKKHFLRENVVQEVQILTAAN